MTPAALKSEDGFTLAEAVMSLLVVSLMLAALLATASLCVRTNTAVALEKQDARAIAAERTRLSAALDQVQPVTGAGVVGSDHRGRRPRRRRDHPLHRKARLPPALCRRSRHG